MCPQKKTEHIRIDRKYSLAKTEEAIAKISKAPDSQFHIWLPNSNSTHLFVDSRIPALLATAKHVCVSPPVVRHWSKPDQWDSEVEQKRYASTLCGISVAMYASEALLNDKSPSNLDFAAALESAIRKGGRLERDLQQNSELQSYKQLTLCALDPEFPELPELGGYRSRGEFVSNFRRLRKQFLDDAFSTNSAVKVNQDKKVAEFVFELFQNGFQHGRLDPTGKMIPGLRSLQLRKHQTLGLDAILPLAKGFPELESYLENFRNSKSCTKFFEVSVSDYGLGIAERFLVTRPEYRSTYNSRTQRAELIRDIIASSLSSKLHQPGAGLGLTRALEAVRELDGFVTLRTNDMWLYGNFVNTSVQDTALSLVPTQHTEPASIVGTHYNFLFPAQ